MRYLFLSLITLPFPALAITLDTAWSQDGLLAIATVGALLIALAAFRVLFRWVLASIYG